MHLLGLPTGSAVEQKHHHTGSNPGIAVSGGAYFILHFAPHDYTNHVYCLKINPTIIYGGHLVFLVYDEHKSDHKQETYVHNIYIYIYI